MNSKPPPWPATSGASARKVAEAAQKLCLRCGLCCNGALFDSLHVSGDEVFKFRETALRFFTEEKSKRPFSAAQPCLCHVDGRCSIFPNRPDTCSGYSCNLLNSVTNGRTPYEEALEIVVHAKKQFDWLDYYAKKYDYYTPRIRSMKELLSDLQASLNRRAQYFPIYKYEVEFCLNAFEFLQNLDRYFEDDFMSDFSNLIILLSGSETKIKPSSNFQYRRNINHNIVEFIDCPEVISPFSAIINGYIVENSDRKISKTNNVELRIMRLDGRYHWDTPYPGPHSKPDRSLDNLDSLLSDLHYNVDGINSRRAKDHFHLHAAAVELSGGLVLLIGDHRVGKTVLSLTIAARGYRLFGDDQISIDTGTGQGVSLGRAPLLRLPLGKNVHLSEMKTIDYESDEKNESSIFIDPDCINSAKMDEKNPIIGVVLLHRKKRFGRALVEKAALPDVFQQLVIRSNIDSGEIAASTIVENISNITRSAENYVLKYYDAPSAADAILGVFEGRNSDRQ